MKPLIRIATFLVFLIVFNIPVFAQKPSLTETLDWIKGKLNDEYPVALTLPSDGKVVVENLELVRFDGCQIIWRTGLDGTVNTEWRVGLSALDPTKVKVREFGGIWRVYLYTYNSRRRVRQNLIGKVGKVVPLGVRTDCFFDFRSEEMAERVAKAFSHAIKLCGGRKEPF